MDTSVSIRRLGVAAGRAPLLKDITVDIPAGKIVGLLGPSGAGKTTLMRAIVGRQRLTSGEVSVLGQPAGSARIRRRIGYMTQGLSVYTDLTVQENLRYFAAMLGVGRQEAGRVIAEVDLAAQSRQLVRTLSGGQKSRVSLAAALLGRPDLLVLDEPTVGVDPVLRQQLWHLFRELAGQGKTLIVSSHVMDEASRCDDLILIRQGSVLAHGAPQTLCRQTGARDVEGAFLKLVETPA